MPDQLESGYYWVRVKYRVAVGITVDEWKILLYDRDEEEWLQCGSEIEISSSNTLFVEVDPVRIEHE